MKIVELQNENKEEVERIAANSWGGVKIAVHRELYDLRELPCFIALSDKTEILGYCYYRIANKECEIMAVESIQQGVGVGTALIKRVEEMARRENCARIYLQTTNDNTHALRYYQRHGFTMCAVRLNELDFSRELKPTIPLIGEDDIPLPGYALDANCA